MGFLQLFNLLVAKFELKVTNTCVVHCASKGTFFPLAFTSYLRSLLIVACKKKKDLETYIKDQPPSHLPLEIIKEMIAFLDNIQLGEVRQGSEGHVL